MGPGEREFFSFVAMFLAGGLVGLAYDLGAAVRSLSGRRSWLPAVVDATAVAMAGLAAGALWFRLTWGERRSYLLAAVLLGAACYRLLASPLLGPTFGRGARCVKDVWEGAGRGGRRLAAAARGGAARFWVSGRSWVRRAGRFL